ncbi:serine/threonine protein phosphatase 1 [Modicisalibacter muralis]|uniref:Serine/threonine protein phosphatase 1 n=1 Tax=Modicisalibacter muralis TaxID=119000 RepID=A0A1G9MV78_9GAMM|nr:metallophosphoesterase [Halomonas muralis]SDL78196.1 serine/threonine protein phosphatase 1 [Halomonas muralis]
MIERHSENAEGRDYFVGDIHGQLRLLEEALARIEFDKKRDRLFCVGDLIDRGSDSFDCLSLAFEPWFYGVRGNHEMLAYDALNGDGSTDLWMINGGTWALSQNMAEVKQILGEALRYLPYAREVELSGKRIGMVHAEPPGDWSLIELAGHAYKQELVWGRSRIKSQDQTPVAGIDAVVVGHTIVAEPAWLGNVLFLDTGAFLPGGKLSLIAGREVLAWQQRRAG